MRTIVRRTTAADVAREAGVSRATVGFVLNSTPGQTISEVTRSRVIDAAQRIGYRPHLAAQALASGRSKIVLLVLPDWPMEYSLRRHVDEISAGLDEAGYSLVTMTSHPSGKSRPLWETLQPDVVMGILPFTRDRFDEIRAAGVPVVIPTPEDAVGIDELTIGQGPRLQVEHLLSRGRRQLAFAYPRDPRLHDIATARFAAAHRAARANGLAAFPRMDVDAESVRDVVAAWHRQGVTGVVAYNDDIAALVVGAAIRLGLDVPGDLAIVGHDDSPLAQLFLPSLTSIHVDDTELGRYFAQLALDAATGAPLPPRSTQPLASVIVRESA